MTTFVLIPGAGGVAWYWSRLVPLLEQAGHRAIAVDLPGDDESAGLPEYADLVVAAVGADDDVVVVAQSLGGFTAADGLRSASALRELVFVNAMIPVPGESPDEWWRNVDSETAARCAAAEAGGYTTEFDLADLLPARRRPGRSRPRASRTSATRREAAFDGRCTSTAWPDIPIRVARRR